MYSIILKDKSADCEIYYFIFQIDHFPNDAYARNANGLLLERQKLYRSSTDEFLASLEYVSNDSEKDAVLVNLSRIMIVLGKYIDAIEINQKIKTATFKSHCQLALALFKGIF